MFTYRIVHRTCSCEYGNFSPRKEATPHSSLDLVVGMEIIPCVNTLMSREEVPQNYTGKVATKPLNAPTTQKETARPLNHPIGVEIIQHPKAVLRDGAIQLLYPPDEPPNLSVSNNCITTLTQSSSSAKSAIIHVSTRND